MSETTTVLFGEKDAGVYLLSTIYDPDVDGTDVSASGKIVPAVGSLIIDDTTGLHNEQYTVIAVDNETYKVTMVPSTYVTSSESQVDRILSYGNDIYMLYYSTVTTPVDGVNINLTRLIVDNKLSLFGNHASTYQITRATSFGTYEVISRWYENSTYVGTSVPMLDTGITGLRKCDGCYTTVDDISDGDILYCNVYSASGLMIATIQLTAKTAYMLNETASTANPIVSMSIEANQMLSDGSLCLYQNQSVEELAIFVKLHYSDGTYIAVDIDSIRGFVYGLEQLTTTVVDNVGVDILVKYYLSEADLLGVTDDSLTDSNETFISKTVKVYVVSLAQDSIAKISPIPVWDNYNYKWDLYYLCYKTARASAPTGTDEVTVNSGWDAQSFDTTQEVSISTNMVVYGQNVAYDQTFVIQISDVRDANTTHNWLIKDSLDSNTTYGDDTDDYVRPTITYTATNGYHIDISATTSQSALEVFLENFYTRATPPKLSTEAEAPTPTHFIVKSVGIDGTASLMTARVAVEDFANQLDLDTKSGLDNCYTGTTLVVEFYRVTDYTDEVLYGVPVDVVQG